MLTLIFALPNLTVDLVAQLVEHNTFNVGALGSSPSGITKVLYETKGLFIFGTLTENNHLPLLFKTSKYTNHLFSVLQNVREERTKLPSLINWELNIKLAAFAG